MTTTNTLIQSGRNFILRHGRITTNYTIYLMYYYYPIFVKKEYLYESLWIGSSLVFQCAWSCLGCPYKSAKVQLELLIDPDMLLMIEGGIRGAIATISHRHAKDNNEYMGTEFDPAEESKFISYLWLGNVETTSNFWV